MLRFGFYISLLFCVVLAADSVYGKAAVRNFESLERIIKSSGATRVEDVLPLLDTDLRSNYSLITTTRSTQFASPEEPRVNLFAKDASFVLAFAGSEGVRGGNTIETIHLAENDKTFQFGQVVFTERGPVFNRPGKIISCFACHATTKGNLRIAKLEAHPIFDSYPDWPDRYGISHLLYMGRGAGSSARSPRLDEALKNFIGKTTDHPRYKYLLGLKDQDSLKLGEMNTDLGNMFGMSIYGRAARNVYSSPAFSNFEKALKLSDRADEAEFLASLSEVDRADFLRQRSSIKSFIVQNQEAYYQYKVLRYRQASGLETLYFNDREKLDKSGYYGKLGIINNFDVHIVDYQTRLYFLLKKMNLPTEMLNFTFEPHSFAVANGGINLQSFDTYVSSTQEMCELRLQLNKSKKEN